MEPTIIQGNIQGLEWQSTQSVPVQNGTCVVSFPTTHLVHLVFHGEKPFRHTHFGIHLGFSDRLTFLGPQSKIFNGYFVDCRKNSPTLHNRAFLTCSPSSKRTLLIPCGVAHAFDGMEGIDTLNSFEASLPHPSVLLTKDSPWASGADIQYFPLDAKDEDLPVVQQNMHSASETFYDLLSEMQEATLGSVAHEYPHTEEVVFPDGSSAKVMIRKPISQHQHMASYEHISDIPGLAWRGHLLVWSGPHAGYSAFVDRSMIEIVDYGQMQYSVNEYSVNLAVEHRLTFLGSPSKMCNVSIIDCRIDSPTCHKEYEFNFHPSAFRFLCIPPGVAYAFKNMDNTFAINRPRRCAGDFSVYETDEYLHKWPIGKKPAPKFDVDQTDAPLEYYKEQVKRKPLMQRNDAFINAFRNEAVTV
jgi:dTDP-4-dehydrorhamnose 3,5-epimerase-like enzyme